MRAKTASQHHQTKTGRNSSCLFFVLFSEHRFVILAELFDALVGQRMLGHLLDDLVGNGGNVGAGEGAFGDVHGMADAGRDDLGGDAVGVEYLGDFGDEVGAADADVIETANERADKGSAGTGGEQSLVGREDERHIDFDAFGGQGMTRLESFHGHRNLDDHILVDLGDLASFADHAFGVGGGRFDFAADGAVDDGGDLGYDLLEIAPFFGDEGRIGGDSANDAHVIGFPDVVHIGCV